VATITWQMFAMEESQWKPVFIHTIGADGELVIFTFTMVSSSKNKDANELPIPKKIAPAASRKFFVIMVIEVKDFAKRSYYYRQFPYTGLPNTF
jgi:hypothetical protein